MPKDTTSPDSGCDRSMTAVEAAAGGAFGGQTSSTSGTQRQPVKRGMACHQCRKKKLKCDTLKPHCTNCLKHHSLQPDRASREVGCTWDEEKQPDLDPPPRKRRDGGKEKIQQLEGKIAQLERIITQQVPEGSQLPPNQSNFYSQQQQQHASFGFQQGFFPQQQQQPTYLQQYQQSLFVRPPQSQQPQSGPSQYSFEPPNQQQKQASPSTFFQQQSPPPQVFVTPPQMPQPPTPSPSSASSSTSGPNAARLYQGTCHPQQHTSYPYPTDSTLNLTASSSSADSSGGLSSAGPALFSLSPSGPLAEPNSDGTGADFDLENDAWFRAIVFPGYSVNLPPPSLMLALVETFFAKVPSLPKMLHKAQFMTRLTTLPPSSPNYPHPAILHAIAAITALHSGRAEVRPSMSDSRFASGLGSGNGDQFICELKDPGGIDETSFGAKQAAFAKAEMELEFGKGERLFDALIAAVLLAYFDYQNARWVQVWISSAMTCRLAVPLGVNESSCMELHYIPHNKPTLLPPSDDPFERESRRRVFWMAFAADRMASASSGWAGSLDDFDITAELPTRYDMYSEGSQIIENHQSLLTSDLFQNHPSDVTDSFVLHIKSLILLSRVKQFNRRYLKPVSTAYALPDPRTTAAFREVMNQVSRYTQSFPPELKDPLSGWGGTDGGGNVDPDLIIAHTIPFVCQIVLHETHMDLTSATDPSARVALEAVRGMLKVVYMLLSTTFDYTCLHPFTAYCWFIAGRTLCRFYEAALQKTNTDAARMFLSEIEAIRTSLTLFGDKVPLAERQCRMLDMVVADAEQAATPPTGGEAILEHVYPQVYKRKSRVLDDTPANSNASGSTASPIPIAHQQPSKPVQTTYESEFQFGFPPLEIKNKRALQKQSLSRTNGVPLAGATPGFSVFMGNNNSRGGDADPASIEEMFHMEVGGGAEGVGVGGVGGVGGEGDGTW